MLNQTLAWIVVVLLLVYFALELGWGGSSHKSGFESFRRQKDILWIRWRRAGLYPPEPPDERDPAPPKPKTPTPSELVG